MAAGRPALRIVEARIGFIDFILRFGGSSISAHPLRRPARAIRSLLRGGWRVGCHEFGSRSRAADDGFRAQIRPPNTCHPCAILHVTRHEEPIDPASAGARLVNAEGFALAWR